MASSKIAIGGILVAIGIAGLVYSMPIVANTIAAGEGVAHFDSTKIVSGPITSVQSYLGIEGVSVAVLTGGMALMALGQGSNSNAEDQNSIEKRSSMKGR